MSLIFLYTHWQILLLKALDVKPLKFIAKFFAKLVSLIFEMKKKPMGRQLCKVKSKDRVDPNYKKLIYIRYVDNFIVGLIGSRKDSVYTKNKIRIFLNENLKLIFNNEKTFITNFSKKPVKFLGVCFKDF
jgi:hypothetical protein